jgi:hypothetical protein
MSEENVEIVPRLVDVGRRQTAGGSYRYERPSQFAVTASSVKPARRMLR